LSADLDQATASFGPLGITMPADDCCRLYQDHNYTGTNYTFCLDGKSEAIFNVAWDSPYWNDKMTSWICGKSVEYWFCDEEPSLDCRNGHGELGAGPAYNPAVGHNDKMTTIKLYPYDPINGPGAAIIFKD